MTHRNIIITTIFITAIFGFLSFILCTSDNDKFVNYHADLKKQEFKLYWKDDAGKPFRSLQNLKKWLNGRKQTLAFAMNAGMYKTDNSPQGLFIEDNTMKMPLDTTSSSGNFYLKPNGVFYTTIDNKATICKTQDFIFTKQIKYATQSGPMLVIDGKIHSAFNESSTNLNIRNGVGVLPDNTLIFAMSKKEINFYDFALYFKNLGCKNALYLDGLISRTYCPGQNWTQLDGDFGAIIGIIVKTQ